MSETYVNWRFLEEYKDFPSLPDRTRVAGYPEFTGFETLGDYRSFRTGLRKYLATDLAGMWDN